MVCRGQSFLGAAPANICVHESYKLAPCCVAPSRCVCKVISTCWEVEELNLNPKWCVSIRCPTKGPLKLTVHAQRCKDKFPLSIPNLVPTSLLPSFLLGLFFKIKSQNCGPQSFCREVMPSKGVAAARVGEGRDRSAQAMVCICCHLPPNDTYTQNKIPLGNGGHNKC